MKRGAKQKYDYAGFTFEVVKHDDPLRKIIEAFRSLKAGEALEIKLNGATHRTCEALRNNFYVNASGRGRRVHTTVDAKARTMHVWLEEAAKAK